MELQKARSWDVFSFKMTDMKTVELSSASKTEVPAADATPSRAAENEQEGEAGDIAEHE